MAVHSTVIDDRNLEIKLRAVGLAASVFAQISDEPTVVWKEPSKGNYINHKEGNSRTLKDFRESCDLVFTALGLDAIDWEENEEK